MPVTVCGGFRSSTQDIAGEVCLARPENTPEHVPAARPSDLLEKRVAYSITSGRNAVPRRQYACLAGGVDDGCAGDHGRRNFACIFSGRQGISDGWERLRWWWLAAMLHGLRRKRRGLEGKG